MIISVVNHSNSELSDTDLQPVIRAVNRQIAEDFEPYWSMSATLRLEGRSVDEPDKANPSDMRGDAVLYIWNKSDVKGAIGYHQSNNRGIPYAFVFLDIAKSIAPDEWTATLSHEALELLADPEGNLLVMGPHPDPAKHYDVFHWLEMCDAVQSETYKIDGVRVSNFVLPLYFTGTREADEVGARNDFLGTVGKDGLTLPSFGVNPGGYVGFFDPQLGKMQQVMVKGDTKVPGRVAAKIAINETRRSMRRRDPDVRQAATALSVAHVQSGGRAASTMIPIKAPVVRHYVPLELPTAAPPPPPSRPRVAARLRKRT